MFQQHIHHRIPQNKTTAWAHVPAAFPPLEYETASPVFEEKAKQARRGDVQIGGDAILLQGPRLVRAPSGD